MIINIRGLSGSGKSTSVKNIMSLYDKHQVLLRHKHRPLITRCSKNNFTDLIVIGPYDHDVKTTGCDIIQYNEQVKLLVKYFHQLQFNVLFESMILSTSNMPLELAQENIPTNILLLQVPIDIVKQQRQNRSLQRGNTEIMRDAITNEETLLKSFNKVCENDLVNGIITSQDNIVNDFIKLVSAHQVVEITNTLDLFELKVLFDNTTSLKNSKKVLPTNLFEEI